MITIMRREFVCCLFFLMLLVISGCVPLIVGGAVGAVGAYAVSKDTIEGETDKPYEELWGSALLVCRIRGNIKEEDSAKGYIELETDGSRVWIRLIRLTRSTTRMRIAARKLHLPNIALAQDIYVKIMEGAK